VKTILNNMDEIIKRCKFGVYLTVNEHRDYYSTASTFIDATNERAGRAEIDEELATRLIEADTIVRLQFYPDTPVGFYLIYGTTLEEVVSEAKKLLEKL